jgi:type VI secretion system secreted protein Hcp
VGLAQVDYFLKIEGIQGESRDAKHKDQIELESFSWGETQSGIVGPGGGAGKVQMQDFHFVKRLDKASPKLFLACASGQHIKGATLVARKAGKDQQEFLIYKFTDILVSSYQTGGSAHGELLPMDQVSFNFARIQVEYRPQNPDGSLGTAVKAGWDVTQNKPI